jgi:hypothetical protein
MNTDKTFTIAAGVLVFLAATKPAHAYLDPGTGSYIFQLLVAGLLGSTFFLRTAIKKIRRSLGKRPDNEEEANEER